MNEAFQCSIVLFVKLYRLMFLRTLRWRIEAFQSRIVLFKSQNCTEWSGVHNTEMKDLSFSEQAWPLSQTLLKVSIAKWCTEYSDKGFKSCLVVFRDEKWRCSSSIADWQLILWTSCFNNGSYNVQQQKVFGSWTGLSRRLNEWIS